MEEILKALELKKQLDSLRPIDKEQEAKIIQKFRLDWNYHSNNLEGNSLTYGETKALLLFNITAQGKPLKDHFEITGHNEAINWVIEVVNGDRPLTENFMRELHTLLLKESYEVDAITPDGQPTKKRVNVGSYKSTPNHVKTKTGEIFYFATPEETPAEMAALMQWYNEKIEQPEVNPILLAAEFHYKFIRIHPFDDGNGRTARILMNFILMKFGYPPVIIKTEDKANYFATLQLADAGNIEAFVDYIAKNLNRSLEIMIAGARGEDIEEPDDIDKEIALLEKKLTSFGDRSKMSKNILALDILLENVFLELYNRIITKSRKLSELYIETYLNFLPVIPEDIFENWYSYDRLRNKTEILLDCNKMEVLIEFKNFTVVGFNGFNYTMRFVVNLFSTYYSIYGSGNTFLIQKPYGISLSESEFEKIVLPEIKRHKDFIEQKIAEKEKEL